MANSDLFIWLTEANGGRILVNARHIRTAELLDNQTMMQMGDQLRVWVKESPLEIEVLIDQTETQAKLWEAQQNGEANKIVWQEVTSRQVFSNLEIIQFAMGVQGGTLQQAAKELGVKETEILYADHAKMHELCRAAQKHRIKRIEQHYLEKYLAVSKKDESNRSEF